MFTLPKLAWCFLFFILVSIRMAYQFDVNFRISFLEIKMFIINPLTNLFALSSFFHLSLTLLIINTNLTDVSVFKSMSFFFSFLFDLILMSKCLLVYFAYIL